MGEGNAERGTALCKTSRWKVIEHFRLGDFFVHLRLSAATSQERNGSRKRIAQEKERIYSAPTYTISGGELDDSIVSL